MRTIDSVWSQWPVIDEHTWGSWRQTDGRSAGHAAVLQPGGYDLCVSAERTIKVSVVGKWNVGVQWNCCWYHCITSRTRSVTGTPLFINGRVSFCIVQHVYIILLCLNVLAVFPCAFVLQPIRSIGVFQWNHVPAAPTRVWLFGKCRHVWRPDVSADCHSLHTPAAGWHTHTHTVVMVTSGRHFQAAHLVSASVDAGTSDMNHF